MTTVSIRVRRTDDALEELLIRSVRVMSGGAKLEELVVIALKAGYVGKSRGELTLRVNRIINRLVKTGQLRRRDCLMLL